MNLAGRKVNDDGIGDSLSIDGPQVVAHGGQLGPGLFRPGGTFELQDFGKPLVMGSRQADKVSDTMKQGSDQGGSPRVSSFCRG